jgi:hypothetical protein
MRTLHWQEGSRDVLIIGGGRQGSDPDQRRQQQQQQQQQQAKASQPQASSRDIPCFPIKGLPRVALHSMTGGCIPHDKEWASMQGRHAHEWQARGPRPCLWRGKHHGPKVGPDGRGGEQL